jgi:hypothetical protein
VAPPEKDGASPEDKPPPPDWAEIYTDLMCEAHQSNSEIANMTIPAIEAIRKKLGKHVEMRMGIPGLFGGSVETEVPPSNPSDKPPKLSEFLNFANAFNGI